MSDEEIKKLILARRAAFIAAAVASLAVANCEPKPADHGPCLSPVPTNDDQRPQVCLSQPMARPDAGAEPTAPDASAVAPTPDASPMPCLSPMNPPQAMAPDAAPTPCLSGAIPPSSKP